MLTQGKLVLNTTRANTFCHEVDELMLVMMWLCVITGGGSSRGSEVHVQQLRNTSTAPRSLYVDLKTRALVLAGHYNKVRSGLLSLLCLASRLTPTCNADSQRTGGRGQKPSCASCLQKSVVCWSSCKVLSASSTSSCSWRWILATAGLQIFGSMKAKQCHTTCRPTGELSC